MRRFLICCSVVAVSLGGLWSSPASAEPPCGAIECPDNWPCERGRVCGDGDPLCVKVPTATGTMTVCGPGFGG